jgi:hypothetical protein
MAKRRETMSRDAHRKDRMWATISASVQSGWGSTLRLLVVIALRGALPIVAVLAGGGGLFGLLTALVDKLP